MAVAAKSYKTLQFVFNHLLKPWSNLFKTHLKQKFNDRVVCRCPNFVSKVNHYTVMTEQELVKKCLGDICRKNGFGNVTAMTQRDFELISQEIDDNTGILISVSTIKRLLNGEFSRMPQTATLNAISTYLGYKNWQEYKISVQPAIHPPAQLPQTAASTVAHRKSSFSINWKWAGLLFVTIAIIVFLSFINLSTAPAHGYEKAQFSAKKTTENAVPNTVIFSYNIDNVNADSFFIQQSWDKRKKVRIYKNHYTLTDIYFEPGYHIAKLIANDSVIKTMDVSIPTDKWFLYAKDISFKNTPQYIKVADYVKNGVLGVNKHDLDSNGISNNEEKNFIYTYFPSKMDVNSDNFTLKARVRANAVRNNQCPFIMYEVFCQRRFMFFKSMLPGCASETNAQFGDTYLNGKENDLSPLCYEVSQWKDIELTVKNRQVTILFDNKQVFSSAYTVPLGLITGLGFISNGLCEVDFTELKGSDGKIVYANEFDY